jgi:hypothetical protein
MQNIKPPYTYFQHITIFQQDSLICNHVQFNMNNEIIPRICRDWIHFVVLLHLSGARRAQLAVPACLGCPRPALPARACSACPAAYARALLAYPCALCLPGCPRAARRLQPRIRVMIFSALELSGWAGGEWFVWLGAVKLGEKKLGVIWSFTSIS